MIYCVIYDRGDNDCYRVDWVHFFLTLENAMLCGIEFVGGGSVDDWEQEGPSLWSLDGTEIVIQSIKIEDDQS